MEKFHGMIRTMRRSGLELKDEYIKWCVSDDAHDERFVKSIEQFLHGIPACTAIICCNYIIYCYVKKALMRNGKKVPEDYSLVCFDYSDENWVEEGITCSISQGYLTGVRLAENLMKMIDRKECSGARYSCVMDSTMGFIWLRYVLFMNRR